MNNYPDGAANDPDAPWNKKDPVMIECEYCDGTGIILPEEEPCFKCNGTGEIEEEND